MPTTPPPPEIERRSRERGSFLQGVLHSLFDVLRWIGSHVRGFYAAVGAFLLLGLGVLVATVLVFAGLAALMDEGQTQRFDDAVLLWINQHASSQLDVLALEVTALGSGFVVWMVVLVASAFLWTSRNRYSVALLWIAFLGGALLNSILKALFDRPRPDLFEWRTDYAGQSSFPSGHAMTGMVVYATLAYLVARLEPSHRMRRLTLGLAAVVILLIGLSRLYLGVHYPSDVAAGFVVGLGWATFCVLGIEAARYFRHRRPEASEEEKGIEKGTEPIRDAVAGVEDPNRAATARVEGAG